MMTAAPLIALLVATVKTFSMVVPTIVLLAVMLSAFMVFSVAMTALVAFPVMMTVVVALRIGIILEGALCKRFGCCVRRTGYAAVELDARLGQRVLRAHADAAADQDIHLRGFQEACQRAMPTAVGRHDLFLNDFTVLHIIKLELLRVTEVLENLSVLISYRNSHSY